MSDQELAAWLAADLGRIIAVLDERDAAQRRADKAEERAEWLREVIARNVECAHYATGCDCGSELRDALAADDAARGDQ